MFTVNAYLPAQELEEKLESGLSTVKHTG